MPRWCVGFPLGVRQSAVRKRPDACFPLPCPCRHVADGGLLRIHEHIPHHYRVVDVQADAPRRTVTVVHRECTSDSALPKVEGRSVQVVREVEAIWEHGGEATPRPVGPLGESLNRLATIRCSRTTRTSRRCSCCPSRAKWRPVGRRPGRCPSLMSRCRGRCSWRSPCRSRRR